MKTTDNQRYNHLWHLIFCYKLLIVNFVTLPHLTVSLANWALHIYGSLKNYTAFFCTCIECFFSCPKNKYCSAKLFRHVCFVSTTANQTINRGKRYSLT